MRADQAAAYLASSKRKFEFIDRMLQRNINRSVKNGPPLDFELSYVQKLHFAVQLLQQTRHRLLLLSLLDLDLIEGLDPDLRREVLDINAQRHQRILEAHPMCLRPYQLLHGGNLAFFVEPAGFSLAPSYDQLPMRYAPQPGGDVAAPPLTPDLPLPAERECWLRSAPRALGFWRAASADARISEPFRNLCARNADALGWAIELA